MPNHEVLLIVSLDVHDIFQSLQFPDGFHASRKRSLMESDSLYSFDIPDSLFAI